MGAVRYAIKKLSYFVDSEVCVWQLVEALRYK
jgi:hypothetical protein